MNQTLKQSMFFNKKPTMKTIKNIIEFLNYIGIIFYLQKRKIKINKLKINCVILIFFFSDFNFS